MERQGSFLTIYPPKKKLLLLAAVFSLMTLLAVGTVVIIAAGSFIVQPPDGLPLMEILPRCVICMGTTLLAGYLGWQTMDAIYRLFASIPSVVVLREGLAINPGALSSRFVKWDNIVQISEYTSNWLPKAAPRMISVMLRDRRAFLSGLAPIQRLAVRCSTIFGVPPIVVFERDLPFTIDDLLARIERGRTQMRVPPHQPQETQK